MKFDRVTRRFCSNGRRSSLPVAATTAGQGRITITWIWTRGRWWRSNARRWGRPCPRSFAAITICWCPSRTMPRFKCHPRHRHPWTQTTNNCWPSTPPRWSRMAITWLTRLTPSCRRSSTTNHQRRVNPNGYCRPACRTTITLPRVVV